MLRHTLGLQHMRVTVRRRQLADRDRQIEEGNDEISTQDCETHAGLSHRIRRGSACFGRSPNRTRYIENPPQPAKLVQGGGELREIMKVAAAQWERVFKRGGGNWKLTIEYGWAPLLTPNLFAQEYLVSERGNNPSRIGHSCILFNTVPPVESPLLGLFATRRHGITPSISTTQRTRSIPSTGG